MRKQLLAFVAATALLVTELAGSCMAGFIGQTINFDFNGEGEDIPDLLSGGADVFAGDNAVLSSPGGTTWNNVDAFSGASVANVPDQFGAPTPVDLDVLQTDSYAGLTGDNQLQDSGLTTPTVQVPAARGASGNGGPVVVGPDQIAFVVSGLLQDEFYNLSVYIAGGDGKGSSTSVDIHHAAGTANLAQFSLPTYMLPGDAGGDYFLFNGLLPTDQGGGNYGFLITASGRFQSDPAYVGGIQVQGLVPEPSTLGFLLVGIFSLWRLRRR